MTRNSLSLLLRERRKPLFHHNFTKLTNQNERKLGSHIPDGYIDLESTDISSRQYMDITGKPYTGN